jgi:hypothetical protein
VEKNKDKGREFRLRPRKPAAGGERRVYASAYKIVMHHARMSGFRRRRVVGFGTATHSCPYSQRCAVRVLYSKNTSKGQWRAHGRYVARESATHEGDPWAAGFSTSRASARNSSGPQESWITRPQPWLRRCEKAAPDHQNRAEQFVPICYLCVR